ncbi:MAG: RNA degradosome polyphosphate kinase, partial [Salinisphaeraceae bacterium]|nr:RNA degradosome polyphosphate kinase [Salinisphaeraceae bacterium]
RSELSRVLDAPFKLYDTMLGYIEREAEHARAGRSGRIIAKMNGLVEPGIIKALYAASQAGVQIDLIVRGMCCLRPGVEGVSENIRVRSIMGRFLEHPRVYYFANNDAPELYLSSADWMERNLFNRVEAAFPLCDEAIFQRVLADLNTCLADNSNAWELQSDGSYLRRQPAESEEVIAAQTRMLDEVREIAGS